MSRNPERAGTRLPSAAEVVRGDVHDAASLAAALNGIDAAYYLVHSMESSEFDFEERDRDAARQFAIEAERTGSSASSSSAGPATRCRSSVPT